MRSSAISMMENGITAFADFREGRHLWCTIAKGCDLQSTDQVYHTRQGRVLF